ncbi:MAG TPA: 16S rRNA methyltransferase [Chloroflexota bacterium]|nr:16S rRNA methyltransferase [Chloroflexota bacterium]
MAESADDQVTALVRAVTAGPKYRGVAPDLIAAIGARELRKRESPKEAIKETKTLLHQIHGAFFTHTPRYDALLNLLRESAKPGPAVFRSALLQIMRLHASTAERAPLLDRFYTETLAGLPPIRSVLGLGCGLNPLSIPWMGLPADVTFSCCDIDAGLVEFLNGFFQLSGINGTAEVRDLTRNPPPQAADLVLALKLLPTLETLEHGAGAALLRAVRAPWMLVSFAARSLGGRRAGLARRPGESFMALAREEGWSVEPRIFPGEVVYVTTKGLTREERDSMPRFIGS